ncbi:hypothetical protein vseg_012878 [Gypsophila vaccaria]
MADSVSSFGLPGFRFKPTDEELISFYLKNTVYDNKIEFDIIGFLNIYRHDPWDLPGLSKIGEREWYFFVPRDRKQGNGGRPNRTTEHGYWKATGSDRKIITLSEPKRVVGLRKTLVFYKGRSPKGSRTDWVMNEYRLPDNCAFPKDIVLCKVYRKATSLRELEERAAKEEAKEKTPIHYIHCPTSPVSSTTNGTTSINTGFTTDDAAQIEDLLTANDSTTNNHIMEPKKEANEVGSSNKIQLPFGRDTLGVLDVPKLGLEWAQGPIFSQSCSPWLDNLLNFSSPTLTQFLFT